ncbi:hypothetical protein [Phenylobacterium sp.]|uniref:hypothetical protein n=1 Tax=Phenylobacterium sp. TaxID=1871053 RepID=UPI00286ABADB|nr:hypothetical protein [Phenylobacterium sp.]
MKLRLYVLRTVLLRILAAAAILLSILQILDLLDVTTDILDRGLGVGGVFYTPPCACRGWWSRWRRSASWPADCSPLASSPASRR